MATYIGIDLGTTYSCIAECDEHEMPTVIPCQSIANGNATPSVVFYDEEGKPIVGDIAKSWSSVDGYAERTLAFIKRSMGQDFCPTPVAIGPIGSNDTRKVSPVEGSACILHALFQSAINHELCRGNSEPKKAVITIPAGYTNKQRSCTKKAAELAGIEVMGLIHEPTAAAICHDIKSGESVLVFDLGGGTLDVSIVNNNQGQYKVLGVASDSDVLHHNIGGKDWDEKLKKLACQMRGYTPSRPSEESDLLLKAEECKKRLTKSKNTSFQFPDLSQIKVTRDDFVKNTRSLVNDCLKVVEACIESADRETPGGKVNINRFIMVGGSSNMPMLKTALSRKFGERFSRGREEPQWLIVSNDAEASIAKGAAKYAFMLEQNPDMSKVTIEEKSSHSYGTSIKDRHTQEERVFNLIKSTDPMIFESREFEFFTSSDNQNGIKVDIYENNELSDYFPLTESLRPIYEQPYNFGKNVPKETKVKFAVSRDKDGLIKIKVTSVGFPTREYEASTLQPPVTSEIENQIKHSIYLMDKE